MRRPHRILLVAVVTLGVAALGAYWVAPVALSMSTARSAPNTARLVPSDLPDLSISQAPGTKLSYFGYEFEVPWSDLDETKTQVYPNQIILTFRSGLRLMAGASPARLWVNGLASSWKVAPKDIESWLGSSDYSVVRTLYEFTPDKMHRWALSPSIHYREILLLTMKSAALLPSASTGIFKIQNQDYRGFQQGNPQARSTIDVVLCSDEGSFDLTFLQKDYQNRAGISQAEINRIVQSLHKSPTSKVNTSEVSTTIRR